MIHPLVAQLQALLPLRDAADREILVAADPPEHGTPALGLRVITYDEDGGVRSMCEQTVRLIPDAHADHPGLTAWLRASLAAIVDTLADDPDGDPLPADLFLHELLDLPGLTSEAEFTALLADPAHYSAILADRELRERRESYAAAVGEARVDALLALRRPRWLLTTEPLDDDDADALAPHQSQLGGRPGLPADLAWPTRGDQPLSFLAQLDLESLPPGEGRELLPPRGVLSVFIGAGADPGRVYYFADPDALVRVECPTDLDLELAPASVEITVDAPTLPGWEQPFYALLQDTFAGPTGDPYSRAAEPLRDLIAQEGPWWPEHAPRHQLLGWPYVLQSDPLAAAAHADRTHTGAPHPDPHSRAHAEAAAEWRLLLQIDSEDHEFMLGDAGIVQVLMRDADLRARRFDRARVVWQSH